jgi:hypothetical protein
MSFRMVCERNANDRVSKDRPSASGFTEANAWIGEQEVEGAIDVFSKYLLEGRQLHYASGQPLSQEKKFSLMRFFAPVLLAHVRVVELEGRRIANPEFRCNSQAISSVEIPDAAHVASVTFQDALVFNEKATDRTLFHALVHATQIQILGLQRFAALFVRGFLRTKSYSLVPMKAHAFEMDARFAANSKVAFSVEDEVWRWLREYRY